MNKFEKLIEYIINDEDQKARELFHNIVVEKSRDIYEDIMAQEEVHGNEVEDMVDQVSNEEAMGEEEEEFSLDGDEDHEGEINGELDGEHDMEPEDDTAEHQEIEHQVMSIDTKLDELLAKFDEIMGGDEHGMEEPGMEKPMGHDEHGMEEPGMEKPMGHDDMEDEPMMEADEEEEEEEEESKGNPFAKKKTEESRTPRIKSTAELMREYTEKIADINLEPSTYGEGDAVGTGNKTGKVAVNKKAGSVGPGNNFGGDANMAHGGEQNADGKKPQTANNEYTKGETEQPLARKDGGYKNKIGGNKPWNQGGDGGHGAEKNGDSETGKTVGTGSSDKPTVNKKPVQVQNTGKK